MKKYFFSIVLALYFLPSFAQSDILLEIGDRKVDVNEFLHIYQKNNNDANSMTFDAMMDYMDLFINFKLKVIEAEKLGLDTTKSFVTELNGYRQQLAQPYLTDKSVEEELIAEAYNRMKQDVKVSHILIKLDPNALPADTLAAWKKINSVYEKLKKGEDFKQLANQYSEDESVKHNAGELGWRTVFGLVYDFESQMYNTEVGKFSQPFRTRFGYHILKVEAKRPAKGRYKVAHIMVTVPREATPEDIAAAEARVAEIQTRIKKGEDFAELAKEYSEDRQTAANGGNLGWIDVGGKMIRIFEDAVFSIENVGDVSEPLKTSYGWHIIKLLEKQEIKSFDEAKGEIKSKISNSARASRSRSVVIERLKKEYNYKYDVKALSAFYKIVTDSIFYGTWDAADAMKLQGKICEFGDVSLTQKDFAEYLERMNRKQPQQPIQVFVDNSFNGFVDKAIVDYEQSRLEMKYPPFKYLMQEYHDGILLFELTDQMVWSKAVSDTLGLQDFHNKNKQNYMWDTRYEVKQYICNSEKNMKALNKMLDKGMSDEAILQKLNKKDSAAVVIGMHGKFLKAQNADAQKLIDKSMLGTEPGTKARFNSGDWNVAVVAVIAPTPKTLDEARGVITADYQNYLESEWIKKLRSRYNIVVHEDVLRKVASKQ